MPQCARARASRAFRAGVGAVQAGDGADGFARDPAFDLADPLDATDLCHGRPIESGDDLAADGDAAALDASRAPSRRSGRSHGGRSHGPATARPSPAGGGGCPWNAAIVSGAKSVAEGDGQIGHERRLVGVDGEQVVAAAVADGLADGALTEHRVPGDRRAVQRQALEQRQGGGDRVGLGWHPQLPDHPSQTAGKGGQRMHARAAIVPSRSACLQALAINRDVPDRAVVACPLPQHRLGRRHVQSLEEVMIHGVARRPRDPQQAQSLRWQPPPPAEDTDQVVGARQHRRQRQDKARTGTERKGYCRRPFFPRRSGISPRTSHSVRDSLIIARLPPVQNLSHLLTLFRRQIIHPRQPSAKCADVHRTLPIYGTILPKVSVPS
jgi:hypothetical protein